MGLLDHPTRTKDLLIESDPLKRGEAGSGGGPNPIPAVESVPSAPSPAGAEDNRPGEGKAGQRASESADLSKPSSPGDLALTVGELLPHLPTEVIKPGMHDADRLIWFRVADLSADIARGRASILVSKLAVICPHLIHLPESLAADVSIRLPLQKLVEQLSAPPRRAPTGSAAHLPESPPRPESVETAPPVERPAQAAPSTAPLVEMRGDLIGSAKAPAWLDAPKAKSPASERKEPAPTEAPAPRSAPKPSSPRIRPLPPTSAPLTKAFSKRKDPAPSPAAQGGESAEEKSLIASTAAAPEATDSLLETPPVAPAAAELAASPPGENPFPTSLKVEGPPITESVEGGRNEEPSVPTSIVQPTASPQEPSVEAKPDEVAPSFETSDHMPTVNGTDLQEPSQETAGMRAPLVPSSPPVAPNAMQSQLQSSPAPPRIRPPAPPPPILATPAAGLRAALAHAAPEEPLRPAIPSTMGPPPMRGTVQPGAWHRMEEPHPQSHPHAQAATSPAAVPPPTDLAETGPSKAVPTTEPDPIKRFHDAGSYSSGLRPPPILLTPAVEEPVQRDSDSTENAEQSDDPRVAASEDFEDAPEVSSQSAEPAQSEPPVQYWPSSPLFNEPGGTSHLLPVRKVSAAPSAVAPMPPLPLSRFNQESLQALFMTEEVLDVSALAKHVAALPGIQASALFAGDEAAQAGEFPPAVDLQALQEMGVQFVATANAFGGRLLGREVEHVTLQGGGFSATLFARAGLCLCVIHRARGFLPGVREKLSAVADELAKAGD